jgi:multidrug efflux pump subunit AcrA (membrane-fusion protein)
VGNDTTEYAIGWNADGTDGIGGLVLPSDMFSGMNGVVSTPTTINAPVLLGTILANLGDVANIAYRVLQGLVDFGSTADTTLGTNTKNTFKDDKLGLIYPVRVRLDAADILVDGKRIAIAPGMAVNAEIITGDRRVIEYVLSPVLRYRSEAGRER